MMEIKKRLALSAHPGKFTLIGTGMFRNATSSHRFYWCIPCIRIFMSPGAG